MGNLKQSVIVREVRQIVMYNIKFTSNINVKVLRDGDNLLHLHWDWNSFISSGNFPAFLIFLFERQNLRRKPSGASRTGKGKKGTKKFVESSTNLISVRRNGAPRRMPFATGYREEIRGSLAIGGTYESSSSSTDSLIRGWIRRMIYDSIEILAEGGETARHVDSDV